jgi:hypothetical protein
MFKGWWESDNKAYILKADHLTLAILHIERTLKGEPVFNPKEVFLECCERLDPKGLASSYRTRWGPLRGAVAYA